jgi:hypothetical protein
VEIYTDSQCAIQSINSIIDSPPRRRWLKFNNNLLLFKIATLIRQKHLNLVLHKVKGYSGDEWNDKADKLAKDCLETLDAYNNIFNHGDKYLRVMPHLDDTTPIEMNIRKYIKRLLNFRVCREWSRLKVNQESLVDHSLDYDWNATWAAIKQIKHFRCITKKRNTLWTFFIKILHNQLPTRHNLNIRRPDLYNKFVCVHCNHENEMTDHLAECRYTQDAKIKIRDSLLTFFPLIPGLKEASTRNIKQLTHLLLGDSGDSIEFCVLIKDAFKGKFSYHNSKHIQRVLKISKIAATKIAAEILLKIVQWIRTEIWLPRCELVQL